MTFPIQSRAAIMKSARAAVLAGKTENDCPPAFWPYQHTWKYEFQQAAKELAADKQGKA